MEKQCTTKLNILLAQEGKLYPPMGDIFKFFFAYINAISFLHCLKHLYNDCPKYNSS